MSFDIFLVTLKADEAGEQLRFDRAIVERAFASFALDQDTDNWQLLMPDGELTSASMLVELGSTITGFSLNRPPFMPTFWDAMFDVMRQTPTFLAWPGNDPSLCVAAADYMGFAPTDFDEKVVVASCGADIEAAIIASTE
jgi:hypothetical protein